MASNYIKVNTDALASNAKDIQSLVKRTESGINKMFSSVEMLDSMWEGPANEAFVEQFRQDNETFLSICKMLDDLAEDMKKAATEYDRCEDEIASAIKRINI